MKSAKSAPLTALAILLLLAPLAVLAPLASASGDISLTDALVLRGYTVDATTGAKSLSSTASGTVTFLSANHARLDDSASAADGVIPLADITLVTQLYGAVVVRAVDTNAANLSFGIGDLSNQLATDYAVVWYDPGTGSYRVWVPGSNYIDASAIYVDPGVDGAVFDVIVEKYEMGAATSPGEPKVTITGDTNNGPLKKEVQLSKGATVTISIASDAGKHDVYVFFPSNPNYSNAKSSTSTSWIDYSSKADVKLWYPGKTKEFTAPEDGTYLFVVVPFTTPGQVTVEITYSLTGGEETPQPEQPPSESDNPAATLPSLNMSAMSLAIIAGVVVLATVAFALIARR